MDSSQWWCFSLFTTLLKKSTWTSVMNSLSLLSVGWATAAPWSLGLGSGSCATAAEEPTATPTCSNASEELFFPFSQSQLHFCRTADILHEGSAASTDCHRPTPRLRFHYLYLLCIVAWGWAWVFLYFWQSTVVACECFMFNKHIYQLRSILVFSQCSLFIYRIFFIHVADIYTQFQGWYKNSAAVHSHE